MKELLDLLAGARAFDLSQPFFVGMPHHPAHPPFAFALSKKHGDSTRPGGIGSACEAFIMGGHLGTHIDALCHFSREGKLHGGCEAAGVQSYGGGIAHLSADMIGLVMRRGILLDVAAVEGVDALPVDYTITPDHLDAACRAHGVTIEHGDCVLLRTGWGRFWDDPARFINEVRGPGPELEGARWLSEHGVFAAGADTVSFEKVPSPTMPVHVHLLVDCGIHIIESLDLEELSHEKIYEFLFVLEPLKLRGATGSPVRPYAVVV